jgi:ComF family protein
MLLKELFSDFVGLLYPPLCVACEAPLPKSIQHICVKCRYDLPKTDHHKVQIESLSEKFENIVSNSALYPYCYFQKGSKFQKIIHHLKYHNRPALGRLLGRWYAHELWEANELRSYELIIPVPLHPSRLRKRGYNQALCIAEGINEVLEISVLPDALIRNEHQQSLTIFGKGDRIQMLREAYRINPVHQEIIEGRSILLVDDVMTTGTTLMACFEALSAAQPSAVSFFVLGAAQ